METPYKVGIVICLIGQCVCLGIIDHYNKIEYERQKQKESLLVDSYWHAGKHIKVYELKGDHPFRWEEEADD
jgi:hypothetical protein